MPKIPVYDRQFDRQSVDLGAPKQSFDTNSAMFGGGDAAGLKSLGGGMADVGTVMLATAKRMKQEEDETAVLDAYRRYHDAVGMQLYGDGSPETGLFNRSGQGAIGATKEAKDAFDRARQEIAVEWEQWNASLPSDAPRWRLGAAGSYPAFCGLICWVGRWLRGEYFFGGCWRGVPGFSSPIRLPMLRLGACE